MPMDIMLCSPGRGEMISLLTADQKAFLTGRLRIQTDDDLDWMNLKQKGTEHSYPAPVRFHWRAEGLDGEQRLIVSTDETFSHSREIVCPPGMRSAEVYNLRAGQKYFWKIIIPSLGLQSPASVF